jgi:hypothetical protein
MGSPPVEPPPSIAALEGLSRAVGPRTFGIALSYDLRYVRPPRRVGDRAVAATLGLEDEPAPADGGRYAEVELRLEGVEGGPGGRPSVSGDCSRCPQSFGPCFHLTTVAIDLAVSRPLREALARGQSTAEAAARAPALRSFLRAEVRFDRALADWISGSAEAVRGLIAAGPLAEADAPIGRTYGERKSGNTGAVLAVTVRRPGDRKLMGGREITSTTFVGRDRRVLEHTRDRGSLRKAVFAFGLEASIAIEAMRLHGGIHAEGYKRLLDFRAELVRPLVTLASEGAPDAAWLDALSAFWMTDDGATRIPVGEATFFPGPFPYVWAKTGAIHRVAPDVDLEVARQLAQAPVLLVPRGRLRDAGASLLRAARGKGVALPAHEAFGLPRVETPRIVLRLSGEALAVSGELVAVYQAREIDLLGPAGRAEEAAVDGGRDLDVEARAVSQVERSGLLQRGPEDDELDDRLARIAVAGEPAVAFWHTGLSDLRAAEDPPVDVQLTERLARVRVASPLKGRVHVALEGDWLDTRVEFKSDEVPVELEVVRAAIARRRRWVTLSDGTLARISASIESLADEAEAVLDGEDRKRLAPHQLGRLDRWIEENDGSMDAAVEALRKRLRALAVAAEPRMPKGLEATLRPYQRLGLAWLQFLQELGAGGILADDMGLGKTVMTLAFLLGRKQREGAAPTLVVCPTSVATNWLREAARFTPGLSAHLLHGPSRDPSAIARHDLVVTTYALLRRDIDALAAIPFRCVVLDEAQNIKNADSATTRAANRLDASMRLALTGTPVENRLRELWSLASFANPGILGTLRAFETRFERPISADRSSPLAAELRAVVRPFLLRRTKDDVLRDLPPKTEIDRVVTLHEADKRMYDALAHAVRESVAKDIQKHGFARTSLSVFTALTRLRQMACDPRLIDAGLARPGADLPSAKRGAFMDLVRELVEEGRRALVFSQFVQLLTLWRRDLDNESIAYEYLDGSTTKRDEVVDRFQRGTAPLFLISLKAGGAGLNLTAADTVIHCDPWWNPAVEDQATDRAHRIGQGQPVTVVRLVARGTIEEKILSLKAKKRELTRAVIGDDARALEGLTEDDVRSLLGDATGDAEDEEGESPLPPAVQAPEDVLATARRVLDPAYDALAKEVQQWLAVTGQTKAQLAARAGIPTSYVSRLARGEPIPCSRAVADRIRARLKAY